MTEAKEAEYMQIVNRLEGERDYWKKQCERLRESDAALARVWRALGIKGYTGKAVWEHVEELKATLDVMQREFARLKVERDHWKTRYQVECERTEKLVGKVTAERVEHEHMA